MELEEREEGGGREGWLVKRGYSVWPTICSISDDVGPSLRGSQGEEGNGTCLVK